MVLQLQSLLSYPAISSQGDLKVHTYIVIVGGLVSCVGRSYISGAVDVVRHHFKPNVVCYAATLLQVL